MKRLLQGCVVTAPWGRAQTYSLTTGPRHPFRWHCCSPRVEVACLLFRLSPTSPSSSSHSPVPWSRDPHDNNNEIQYTTQIVTQEHRRTMWAVTLALVDQNHDHILWTNMWYWSTTYKTELFLLRVFCSMCALVSGIWPWICLTCSPCPLGYPQDILPLLIQKVMFKMNDVLLNVKCLNSGTFLF